MKLWSERDFDECCYAIAGFGAGTMVCAKACRGSYCVAHREAMEAAPRPPSKRQPPRPKEAPRLVELPARRKMPLATTPTMLAAIESVLKAVAARHGLSVQDLRQRTTDALQIVARHEACWELRQLGRSYPQVARSIGMSDHGSAINACRRHQARVALAQMDVAA